MKNKSRRDIGAIPLERCFKNITEKLQKQYSEELLKLSFEVDGHEVNILEELSASMLALDTGCQYRALFRSIKGLDFKSIESMLDNKIPEEYEKYTIINSVNCMDKPFIKYAMLKALGTKNEASGEIITTTVYGILDMLKENSNPSLSFGVDSCIITTVLYWAQDKGILDEFFKYIPPQYFKEVKQLEYIKESYKDALIKANTAFGELYYNFKTNKITKEEYLTKYVSENGTIPLPRNTDLINSPEYSWQVVEEIVGKGYLKDKDYSDEIKEAISHIFQRFYDTMLAYNSAIYNYLVQGVFYSINKDKILSNIRKIEADTKRIETSETKIKELRASIRQLKKESDRQKSENNKLKKTEESNKTKMEKLKKNGLTDIEPYKKQIEQKDSEINDLKKRLQEFERNNTKKDNSIAELENINRELKSSLEAIDVSNTELKDKMEHLISNQGDESIPLECIVNSIKDYRIVIFGGDMLHSTLKNMGFRNLKLVRANDKALSTKELKYADAMVIVTGVLSHATCSIPKVTSENFGTPIMYFNNKSVNKLCKELFLFLNNDSYKKRIS